MIELSTTIDSDFNLRCVVKNVSSESVTIGGLSTSNIRLSQLDGRFAAHWMRNLRNSDGVYRIASGQEIQFSCMLRYHFDFPAAGEYRVTVVYVSTDFSTRFADSDMEPWQSLRFCTPIKTISNTCTLYVSETQLMAFHADCQRAKDGFWGNNGIRPIRGFVPGRLDVV